MEYRDAKMIAMHAKRTQKPRVSHCNQRTHYLYIAHRYNPKYCTECMMIKEFAKANGIPKKALFAFMEEFNRKDYP